MDSGRNRHFLLPESPSPVTTEHLGDSGSERSSDDQEEGISLALNNRPRGSIMSLEGCMDTNGADGPTLTDGVASSTGVESQDEPYFKELASPPEAATPEAVVEQKQGKEPVDSSAADLPSEETSSADPPTTTAFENGHVEGSETRGKDSEDDTREAVVLSNSTTTTEEDTGSASPAEGADPEGVSEDEPEPLKEQAATTETIDAPPSVNNGNHHTEADDSQVVESTDTVKSTDPPTANNSPGEEFAANVEQEAESTIPPPPPDIDPSETVNGSGQSVELAVDEPTIDEASENGLKEAVDAPAKGPVDPVPEAPPSPPIRPVDASPEVTLRKVASEAASEDFDEKKDTSPSENAFDKTNLLKPTEQEEEKVLVVETVSTPTNEQEYQEITPTASNNNDGWESVGTEATATEEAACKRPMDASGRCSVDLQSKHDAAKIEDPPDHDNAAKPPTLAEIKEALGEESSSSAAPALEPMETKHIDVAFEALPTPLASSSRRQSEAANKLAADIASDQQQGLSPDLLANKDKEGFGLLARGESFKSQGLRKQQQQQQQTQPILQQNVIDYTINSSQHRVPQEPDAVHRRNDSAVASLSRSNSGRGAMLNNDGHHLVSLDDNSGRPMEDNSWRPSHVNVSYPHSPQGLPPPLAMAPAGSYMVMSQHQQIQPPHAFMPPPPAPAMMHPQVSAPAMMHPQTSYHQQQLHQQQLLGRPTFGYPGGVTAIPPMPTPPAPSAPAGKRKIKLKLQEEILARPTGHARRGSFFFARSTRKLMSSAPLLEGEIHRNELNRGTITVSWYEGTSTNELQEHVNRSMTRKLKLEPGHTLEDIRILDTAMDPPEEIVLSPYIPSGSEFVVRYKVQQESGRKTPPKFYGPPDSPSAAPSPFPSSGNLGSLDTSQLALLRKQLDAVQDGESRKNGKHYRSRLARNQVSPLKLDAKDGSHKRGETSPKENRSAHESDGSDNDNDNESETNTLQPESSVDAKLRQITELLLLDKQRDQRYRYPQVEKKQVVFVLANYFVLFVALITISAEIQARAPQWLSWVESQLENVHNCSADQEALYKCISNGEFAGLFATLILWLSRSATTKRLFLFGFDSPQKLWTVFYESLVGAFCWGVSYMLIRRGMNPDTRPQFLQKYWKDAVYGSLAGFNATFMKQVLKNLIPQEAVEEAFNDRQLKILSWLPNFA
ncbi:expressed unknown protein [Seminavis robusta]|uniref:Uncharacterized protein n=1 Tax=Seminavis robusta TaxID=568900 RepID=A0A9N8HFV1_9STRA|nr:expressed unknown protein [Seminavis robusta]|eukprot:Sro476_g150610.1 n/a (1183) ;mRNA; f:51203-55165